MYQTATVMHSDMLKTLCCIAV